jgi:hypothetical protein
MPLIWKPKSDEDHVNRVRWTLRLDRAAGFFSMAIGILSVGLGLGIPYMIYNILVMDNTMAPLAEAHPGIWFGWLLGAVGGFFMLMGILQIGLALNSFKGNQTEKLLIKYYDMAKKDEGLKNH